MLYVIKSNSKNVYLTTETGENSIVSYDDIREMLKKKVEIKGAYLGSNDCVLIEPCIPPSSVSAEGALLNNISVSVLNGHLLQLEPASPDGKATDIRLSDYAQNIDSKSIQQFQDAKFILDDKLKSFPKTAFKPASSDEDLGVTLDVNEVTNEKVLKGAYGAAAAYPYIHIIDDLARYDKYMIESIVFSAKWSARMQLTKIPSIDGHGGYDKAAKLDSTRRKLFDAARISRYYHTDVRNMCSIRMTQEQDRIFLALHKQDILDVIEKAEKAIAPRKNEYTHNYDDRDMLNCISMIKNGEPMLIQASARILWNFSAFEFMRRKFTLKDDPAWAYYALGGQDEDILDAYAMFIYRVYNMYLLVDEEGGHYGAWLGYLRQPETLNKRYFEVKKNKILAKRIEKFEDL